MKKKKGIIYLVGAIETANNLGRDWRSFITPHLERIGFEVLNPCILEHEQIKKRVKLPRRIFTRDGVYKNISDWHDLYEAVEGSKWRKLFVKCMQSVMDYDIDIVLNRCTHILCLWDSPCDYSVGSHGELTLAYWRRIPVVIVHTSQLPLSRWGYCCARYGAIVSSFKEAIRWLKKC